MTDIIGPLPEGEERQPTRQPDQGPDAGHRNAPNELRDQDQGGEDGELDAGAVPDRP